MADVIGPEHGITKEQLDDLAKQTAPLIPKIKDEILRSTPGIGPHTSEMLLSQFPEPGQLNCQEIACPCWRCPL